MLLHVTTVDGAMLGLRVRHQVYGMIKGAVRREGGRVFFREYLAPFSQTIGNFSSTSRDLHGVQSRECLDLLARDLVHLFIEFHGYPSTTVSDIQFYLIPLPKTQEDGARQVFHDEELSGDLLVGKEDVYSLFALLGVGGSSIA